MIEPTLHNVAKYISPVTFLTLDKITNYIPLHFFLLTEDEQIIREMIGYNPFIKRYGENGINELFNSPCIAVEMEINSISSSNNLQEFAIKLDNWKLASISCLWLIKDNSINSQVSYVQSGEDNSEGSTRKAISYSNAEGSHRAVHYSYNEISSLIELIPKVEDLFLDVESYSNKVFEDKEVVTQGINVVARNKNRLKRAYQLLNIARSTSDLGLKISFYMATLECLFTSTNAEIAHQLAERASLFVGGDKGTKTDNFDLIKKAYGIRSNLMHGNNIQKTDDDIIRISISIDSLVRKIFNKTIESESPIFQLSEKEKNQFDNYFRDLIFQ